ncbi:VIT domain-containing protein [Puniceicoccus vermicola]|uniref:VWA domain-containing protein n=1 Tax=Puniceicoccus vermicola TaxID=388746 RepID=A0A7X1AVF5_9BACT|nr:VIT domain-containing protein [Puniceicoccus vermicola]MBC2600542.1 VWA domain-containing protein [Puniceicoccus vermicola]
MKTKNILILLSAGFGGLLLMGSARANSPGESSTDRTEVPYFWTPSMKEGVDALPLKSTDVQVKIEGMLATVTVSQVYRNEGTVPIEASYIFPGSTRAAVNDLRFTIGERVISAEIQEKEEARRTYEAAKTEGKRTVLLEQHRPNVFQMKVANILPADVVSVQLVYTETLPRENGDYEFVYPTVVGPRYVGDPEAQAGNSTEWVHSPFLSPETEVAAPEFRLSVDLTPGQTIRRIGSPSHKVDIDYREADHAVLELTPAPLRSDDRDFILRYSLADEEPEVGILLTKTEDGGYFLVNLEPPARQASGVAMPREYLFLLDVSGSMEGFPLTIAKQVMGGLIEDLGSGDSFNIVAFAGSSEVFSERVSAKVSPSSKQRALEWIDGLSGMGGTNLLPALKRVLQLPRDEGTSRTVVVITDGYVVVEREAFELIRNSLGEANLFALGIGSSVNRHLIEGMARAGGGDEFVATNIREGKEVGAQLIKMVRNPVLTQISLDWEGLEVKEMLPERQPDLFLDKPVRVIGRFEGEWGGRLTVTGKAGSDDFEQTVELGNGNQPSVGSIGILWAREKVQALTDSLLFGDEGSVRSQIVELGLRYRLLTRYTSFVAVEEVIARQEEDLATVKQPVPLPAGVSSLAVGAGIPASPEPETVGLVLLVLGALAVLFWSSRKKDAQ